MDLAQIASSLAVFVLSLRKRKKENWGIDFLAGLLYILGVLTAMVPAGKPYVGENRSGEVA